MRFYAKNKSKYTLCGCFPHGVHEYTDADAIKYAMTIMQMYDMDESTADGIVKNYGNDEQKELYFDLKKFESALSELDSDYLNITGGEIGKHLTRIYEEIIDQTDSMVYNSIENVLSAPMERPLRIGDEVELISLDDEADVRDYMR